MKFQVHRSSKKPQKMNKKKTCTGHKKYYMSVCEQHIYLHRKRKWKMLPGCFVLFILLLPEHLLALIAQLLLLLLR